MNRLTAGPSLPSHGYAAVDGGGAEGHGLTATGRGVPDEDVFATGGLLRAAQQAHDRLWQELVPGGFTSPQFAVVHRLRLRPGIDQGTLGEALSLDKASVAELVARLEQTGLVSRKRTASDARRNTLRLTEVGLAACTAGAPWVAQVQLRLTAVLNETETESFLHLIRTVADVVPSPMPGHSEPVLIGLPADPAGIPGHLIRAAQQRHTRCWAAEVGQVPTSPQYGVLYRLAREPGIDQTTLAERVALAKAPAGEIVRRLVERGEVLRTPDPYDGRRKLLALSPHGVRVTHAVIPAVLRVQRQLTAGLTAEERSELLTLLARVCRA